MAKLPESVMVDIQDAVNIFDRIGDGKVAIKDIINVLRALDLNPGTEDWREQINDFVMKDVERIDINEFASIYAEEDSKKKLTLKELVEGLKAVDPQNGEIGLVGRAALTRYMTSIGDTLTHTETDSVLLDVLDKDGRNVIIEDLLKTVMGEM